MESDSCTVCGVGTYAPENGDGRFVEHPKIRGVLINIPIDYVIDRCGNTDCRNMSFTETQLYDFEAMLDKELEEHRELVNSAVARFRARQKL